MGNTAKILFVVEGERTERLLVNRLSEVFDVPSDIFAVRGNIYKLYQVVKDDPFSGIAEVLSEMTDCEADKAILTNVFTDVFLVFDCDAPLPRWLEIAARDGGRALPKLPGRISEIHHIAIRFMRASKSLNSDAKKASLPFRLAPHNTSTIN